MWWDGPWYGFHWWMWAFPVLFLIMAAVLVFRGAIWPMCAGPVHRTAGEIAREILDQRYARGELSADEYRRMRKDLQ
jgi:putative membrane protein